MSSNKTAAEEYPDLIKGRDPSLISSFKQAPLYGNEQFACSSKSNAKKICGGKSKRLVTIDQKTPRKVRGVK